MAFWSGMLSAIITCVVGVQYLLYGGALTADVVVQVSSQATVGILAACAATWLYPPFARRYVTVRLAKAEARWRDCYVCMECKCAFLRNERPHIRVTNIQELLWTRR